MSEPDSGEANPIDLLAEVSALLDDIGHTLTWWRGSGADVLPREARLSAEEVAYLKAVTPGATDGPRVAERVRPPAIPKRTETRSSDAAPGQSSLGNWGRFVQKPAASVVGTSLDRAANLDQVRTELGDCQRCGLCRGRTNIVFGVGSERADLMVIGEAPGANEDRLGEPFVGKAGQMLDRMLSNVLGLDRKQVYIANVVKCRPPGNRNPEPEEIARCRPFLMAQMRVIQPKVVLVLGSVAGRAVFDTQMGITRLRGRWRELSFPGGQAQAMPSFHPAYLLRQPAEKRKTFDDLKQVKAALEKLGD